MASESSVDQEVLRKGIQALRLCDEMISKLGLFSSKEAKDDVSTANLKYLLVPFFTGKLTEKVAEDDRTMVLKVSQNHLKIQLCEALELVPEEELESSSQRGADTSNSKGKKGESLPLLKVEDKHVFTHCKIAHFKLQRGAEAKLQEIKLRKERHQ